MQVLFSFDLFYSLYLLVCRILPLGLLCDRLLCLWAVTLAFLLASSKNRTQQHSVEIVRSDSIKVNSFVILFELKVIWRLI